MNTNKLIQRLNSVDEFQEKLKDFAINLKAIEDNKWNKITYNDTVLFKNTIFNNYNEKVIIIYTEEISPKVIDTIFNDIKKDFFKERVIMCIILSENDLFDVEISYIDIKHIQS